MLLTKSSNVSDAETISFTSSLALSGISSSSNAWEKPTMAFNGVLI